MAHDARTGRIVAIAWGTELGILRTGALGGVAAQALTGGSIRHLAVIGTGRQAWSQLWAVNGFTRPDRVSVHSRDAARRDQFARRAASVLGLTVTSCDTARDAVAGVDMVILATNSTTPVIETGWLDHDVVVTTMGPKQVDRAEFSSTWSPGRLSPSPTRSTNSAATTRRHWSPTPVGCTGSAICLPVGTRRPPWGAGSTAPWVWPAVRSTFSVVSRSDRPRVPRHPSTGRPLLTGDGLTPRTGAGDDLAVAGQEVVDSSAARPAQLADGQAYCRGGLIATVVAPCPGDAMRLCSRPGNRSSSSSARRCT